MGIYAYRDMWSRSLFAREVLYICLPCLLLRCQRVLVRFFFGQSQRGVPGLVVDSLLHVTVIDIFFHIIMMSSFLYLTCLCTSILTSLDELCFRELEWHRSK